MMREKDLEGSQMRVGKEERTRDPHPSQKRMTIMPKRRNSLSCSHGSWPMPWDNGQESQRNPRPCSEMRTTKIYVCSYWHVPIILAERVVSGKTRHNEPDTP